MGRPRGTHRKALLTVLVVGLVAGATGSATYAAFVAQDRNDANLVASGTVQITDDDAGSALFSVTGMKPGDAPVTRCMRVTYVGSLEARVRMYATASGTLAPYLNLTVTRGSGPDGDAACASFVADATDHIGQGAGVVYTGSLAGYPASFAAGIVDPTPDASEVWATSENHSYRFTVSVQDVSESQGGSATAAFFWEARNTFEGVYDDEIVTDSPVAHWRLGEAIMRDDFETFSGWSTEGSGTFAASTEQARSGTGSGKKATNSDPHGGWKSIGGTLGNEWTLETWLYRPSVYSGGGADRIGLEDGSGNGYALAVIHSSNEIRIDRRTGGSASSLSSVSVDPPEDEWFRVVLGRSGSSMTFTIYDATGTQLGQMTASDSTHSSFTRVVVRGGHHYYADDLSVHGPASGIAAVDGIGTHDGTYTGGVTLGAQGLLLGDPDTAVSLDGAGQYVNVPDDPALDFAGQAPMTVEAWVNPSVVDSTCRRIVSKEITDANGTQGYLLYFCNGNFGWQRRENGTSDTASATGYAVAGVTHHVVGTYDGTTLRLYVDGELAGTRATSLSLVDHANPLRMGAISSSTFGSVAGVVDEVAVYDRALSSSRISAHYQVGA